MQMKRWQLQPVNKENARRLAEETGLPYFLGMLLDIRGVRSQEQAVSFLQQGGQALSDPYTFADMEPAVQRIHLAIENGERIAVYGDYDADGVTATAMLYSYLDSVGANVTYYIPDRGGEGYGMNQDAIRKLSEDGVQLIITVDNGVSSHEEVAYAATLGMDVVITDHHRPREALPDAVAVINPHRKDCPSAFKELAGVGVAFKLITALEGEYVDIEGLLENYADLITIGTIGDVVSLTGENRALVQAGLRYMSRTDRIGLQALMEHSGVANRTMTAADVGFGIVPRINATGRMDDSCRSVELLLSEDPEESERLALEVCHNNELRKATEQEILEKVEQLLQQEPDRLNQQVLIVEGENWHHGVIGIVASRLLDRYGKPCLVISCTGEEAKGSGRSVEGFSLFDAIHTNGHLLTKYGGHPMAAGFSLERKNLPAFCKAIYDYAASQERVPVKTIFLDCKLRPHALSVEIPRQLQRLEPFGTDNPAPIFGLYGMTIQELTPVGNGKHLRLVLSKDGSPLTAMRFGVGLEQFPYNRGDVVDLAVQLSAKEFRGEEQLSVVIREIRIAGLDTEAIITEYAAFEKYKRRQPLKETEQRFLVPERSDFVAVYQLLRQEGGWNGHMLALYRKLDGAVHYGRFLVILQAMRELKLIACRRQGERLQLSILPTAGKVDLASAPILQQLRQLGACVGGEANGK